MAACVNRAGLASGVAGAALLAQLFVLRAVSSATESSVALAGRELHWGCSFKQAFGIPCPNCGLTRSVVFALHGQLGRALEMNPAGPLLVLGALLLSAALFHLALRHRAGPVGDVAGRLQRRIILGAALYGGLIFAVLLANWVLVIA